MSETVPAVSEPRTVHAGASYIGARSTNDDRWAAYPETGLFVLADGVATARAGARAAAIAVRFLPEVVAGPNVASLGEAVAALSATVHTRSREHFEMAGAATTLVAALVCDGTATVANLGDSRAYLARGGTLSPLSVDHTLAVALVDAGEVDPRDVSSHPARHTLTRFVGMRPPALPHTACIELADGDRLLLCSDGLHNAVATELISSILATAPDVEAACAELIGAAQANDATDNTTVLVIEWQPTTPDRSE